MRSIEVNDRVKATHTNGDTAEFTVVSVKRDGSLSSESNFYDIEENWSFVRIPHPMPTKPGLYQAKLPEAVIEHARTYRHYGNVWLDALNNEDALESAKKDHKNFGLVRLVWEN